MSDFDPIKWSTRLDGHGLAPAVEPDQYAQWGGHGMEEVRTLAASCRYGCGQSALRSLSSP
jgi:hypothetical protein